MTTGDPLDLWRSNPFYVLEIATDATPTDVERAGQRLLALLTVGSANVQNYQTPLGPATRDAEKVRGVVAALRDPEQRVLHELWANVVPVGAQAPGQSNAGASAGPWEEAEHAFGWSALWAQ